MAEGRRIVPSFPDFWHNHPCMDFQFHRPRRRLFDQNFGVGLTNDDLMMGPFGHPVRAPRHQAGCSHCSPHPSGASEINVDDKNFTVNLDVAHFTPDELDVRVVEDSVIVKGNHEEKVDGHGSISRQFCRRYKIPDNVNPDGVTVSLSHDGVLSLTAPTKSIEQPAERKIPIQIQPKPAVEGAKE